MGKVPRGALFVGERPAKKPRTEERKAGNAVVFLGGRRAVQFGAKSSTSAPAPVVEETPDISTVLSQIAAVSDGVVFSKDKYRIWTKEDVLLLDGDVRKGLNDEEKLMLRSAANLRRSAKDARHSRTAGPLNRAISEHGSDKQLGYAEKALRLLQGITTPTVYTLAGMTPPFFFKYKPRNGLQDALLLLSLVKLEKNLHLLTTNLWKPTQLR